MKKIIYLLTTVVFMCSSYACKKCNECTMQCRNCVQNGFTSTLCRSDYYSDAEFQAAVANQQAQGATCASANETDKVCNSGLFYKTLQSAEIQSREESGWQCD